MQRTTVMLPDDLMARLRNEARLRDTSVAEIVRGAVEREFSRPSARRELGFFAVGRSGRPDLAERNEEILGEMYDGDRRARRDAGG